MSVAAPPAELSAPVARERRNAFRVDDAVGLRLTPLAGAQLSQWRERLRQRGAEQGAVAATGDATRRAEAALSRVERDLPDVAVLFRLLDARLDALGELLTPARSAPASGPDAVANISGSGMSFEADQAHLEGDWLGVELILFPAGSRIEVLAKVVRGRAQSASEGKFRCAIEFCEMSAHDTEVLYQHIHMLQFDALRGRRLED